MGSRIANIVTSIIVVTGITALVLPKRQTPAVLTAGGKAFAGILTAARGS